MCLLFGGYLIEVDDTNEYSFIQGYLNEHGQGEGSCFFQKNIIYTGNLIAGFRLFMTLFRN